MANELARRLRRNRTDAERALWWELRKLKPRGHKFRQQVPIDHYIVDFACLASRLIVEVDGATHSTEAEVERDQVRQQYLEQKGFVVLRFWNDDVRSDIERVMDQIVHVLESTPTPAPPRKGEGK
jgi:very-short-patch-repair endonuclease